VTLSAPPKTAADRARQAANITVAIATRDRPEALAQCLDALQAGTARPGEIIVIDQSGSDETRRVAAQRRPSADRLRYIHHDGRGLGAAQNLAIAHSASPIIAVTDDDCVPAQDWLAKIAEAFERRGTLDGVTGRVLPLGPALPGTYAVASRTSSMAAEFGRRAMPWDVGSGNNFAVKREWLLRIGGLDERLGPGSRGRGGVDMDLFYRLLRAGARLRYEPEVVVEHARTDKAGRLARRIDYGYGMGACCSLWLRQRDTRAVRVLGAWVLMRGRRLLRGAWQRDGMRAYEEALVLASTCGGLAYGWRV